MRDYYTKEEWTDRLAALKKRIESVADGHESVFLDLGGARKVRLVLFAQEARDLIQRELKWVLTDATDEFDATVCLWKESDMISFARQFFVFPGSIEENEYLLIKVKGGDESFFPCGQLNVSGRTIHLVEDNTFFFGAESFAPERWLSEGHILVQMLFRIMNTASNARLVHGACIGLDNKGLLLCARGLKQHQSDQAFILDVIRMLNGMEFYKIILTPDIYKNAVCLKMFLQSTDN